MKETHKDISLLPAPPKPLEVKNHEEMIANKVEAMEVMDGERKERLERVQSFGVANKLLQQRHHPGGGGDIDSGG